MTNELAILIKRMGGTSESKTHRGDEDFSDKDNIKSSVKPHGPPRCDMYKESGHRCYNYSKKVCSVCREVRYCPNTCLKVVGEDSSLASSEGDQLSSEDQLNRIFELCPVLVHPECFLLVLV